MQKIFASVVHEPLSYDVGPLQLTGFGLAVLMSFVIAQIMAQRELARRGHDPEPIGDVVFAAVIGGLLGGKIYYAVLMHDFSAILSRAGFVFWGGLTGGILVCYAYIHWKHLSFTRISDVAAPALAAGYAIGFSHQSRYNNNQKMNLIILNKYKWFNLKNIIKLHIEVNHCKRNIIFLKYITKYTEYITIYAEYITIYTK